MTEISPLLRTFSRTEHPEPPTHLGTRYDTSGTFLPEPGNTVVCHLTLGTETGAAILDARARYLSMPEAADLAFTPISSLHMTLFQGIIEKRRRQPFWPADVPLDTTIPQMTEILSERLKSFAGGPAFNMTVAAAAPTGLKLVGATEADRQALRDWRNAFAEVFGYRHPDHEDYVFHITFSYVIRRFDDAVLPAWQQMLDEVVADINARAPTLALEPPAFCSFDDMNHFEPLLVFTPR
jgi:hypothetical protein